MNVWLLVEWELENELLREDPPSVTLFPTDLTCDLTLDRGCGGKPAIKRLSYCMAGQRHLHWAVLILEHVTSRHTYGYMNRGACARCQRNNKLNSFPYLKASEASRARHIHRSEPNRASFRKREKTASWDHHGVRVSSCFQPNDQFSRNCVRYINEGIQTPYFSISYSKMARPQVADGGDSLRFWG
jgi:hypothetical protein